MKTYPKALFGVFCALLLSISTVSLHSQEEVVATVESSSSESDTSFDNPTLFNHENLVDTEINADLFLADAKSAPAVAPLVNSSLEGQMPTGFNTWIPRFVWVGDVETNEQLKCFAAFLVGSMGNADKAGESQPPGYFATPNYSAQMGAANPMLSFNTAKDGIPTQAISKAAANNTTQPVPPIPNKKGSFVEFQAGVAFLYFDKPEANFAAEPSVSFPFFNPDAAEGNFELKRKIQYNKTPIYELNFGWDIGSMMDFSIGFQTQPNIFIRTEPMKSFSSATGEDIPTQMIFESDLALNSIIGKLGFKLPNIVKAKKFGTSLYLIGNCGAGWQSWTDVKGYYSMTGPNSLDPANQTFILDIKSEYYANFVYGGEAGLLFTPTNVWSNISMRLGCKFIGWGSTRELGKTNDQDNLNFGFFIPLKINTIYSWAPYISFIWKY